VARALRALGVTGILVKAAELGYLTELTCGMPKCFCPEQLGGAGWFAPRTRQWNDWEPTHEHFQIPKRDGGKATPDNTILAHRICNKLDYSISHGQPIEKLLARIEAAREAAAAANRLQSAPAAEAVESADPHRGRIAGMAETAVGKLEALGVHRGILWQLARDGQIIDVRCEMPQCYCFRGRSYFEPRPEAYDWEPTANHYPRRKMDGGRLASENVRLAHRLCNRRDYQLRVKINAMLGKRMSLEAIAGQLNAENVPTIHGTNKWTAASVRKAFVS
jgi:hypothetical protein